MADYTNRGEYRSPRARRVYKAPKKKKTEGEKLDTGTYTEEGPIDTGELAPDGSRLMIKGNPLDDATLNQGKFRNDARQRKIRNLVNKGATEGEKKAARGKLKDQTDLPQFLKVTDPQAEELRVYDEKMRQAGELSGQEKVDKIKEANRSRPDFATKGAQFLSAVWEDTKEFKEWYNLPHNIGAVGARGIESFATFEADDIHALSFEALDKLMGTKGIGMSIIKEIPIIKNQVLPVLARRLSIINRTLNRKASWIKGDLQPALATVDEGTGNFKTYEPLQMSGADDISLSKHYKDKLTVHERALNEDMIGFDQRALDRRAKIDAQFELNSRTGLPEGPRNIRSGSTETARRAKAAWSLGEEVDPQTIKIFEESNQSILDGYNYRLHGKKINVGKTQGHHKGVVRQIFEASNGLNKKYRLKSAKYMQNRIGFELGYHGRNVVPVPERFHPRVHAIINDRISSSQDLFNVEGAAKRLGFPENWQSVLTFEERKPLYNEIADAIRESVDAINTNWEVLLSRSDDLTTYSKEEYLDLMLRHNKLNKKLKEVASPRLMASRKNWDLKDTSTAVLNEILSKSNKKDLTLPWIGKVEPSMATEVQKILRENNGWQYLKEVLLTDKSAATVMKAYPGIELTKKQLNSLDNYSHMLRSRGKSIPPVDSTWNFGQDN